MGWRVWGEWYPTAAMSNTTFYQPAIFDANYSIIGCRIWVINYNDPAFTALTMKVYSNFNGAPKALIATATNTQPKASVFTNTNGAREIFFNFDQLNVRDGETYHFVLNATGYTGTSSSHLAWMRGFPDPVYRPSPFGFEDLAVAPFTLYFVGAEV